MFEQPSIDKLLVEGLHTLNVLLFAALTVIAWRMWRRLNQHSALCATRAFAAVAVSSMAFLIDAGIPGRVGDWASQLGIVVLLLFPIFLFRFAQSFRLGRSRIEPVITTIGLLVITWSFATPTIPSGPGAWPAWFLPFLITVSVYWIGTALLTAYILWAVGNGQPGGIRHRMRVMSAATLLLAMGVAAASIFHAESSLYFPFKLAAAALFMVSLVPPAWLRRLWRSAEQAQLRDAVGALLLARTSQQAIEALLPHISRTVSGRGTALIGAAGEVLGNVGFDDELLTTLAERLAQAPVEQQDVRMREGVLCVRQEFGWVLVASSPLTPLFGREEVQLLRSLGSFLEMALERAASMQEMSRRMLDLSADMHATADVDGHLHDLNNAWSELLGYDPDELENVPLSSLVHPADVELVEKKLGDARANRRATLSLQVRMATHTGGVRNIAWNVVCDDTGVLYLSGRDLTTRFETEARVRDLLLDVEFARQQEQRRIGGELHDFSLQHMSAAIMHLEVARDRAEAGDPGAVTSLELAQNLLRNAAVSVRRIVNGLQPMDMTGVSLEDALRSVCEEVERVHGVRVAFNSMIKSEIDEDLRVLAYRVIGEIIRNAAKHGRSQNVVVTVVVSSSTLTASVVDDGKGWDTPLSLRNEQVPGFGTGTKLILEQVVARGGSYTVESTPGHGATVQVAVPLPHQESDEAPTAESGSATNPSSPPPPRLG